jgi:cytochrome c
MRSTSSILSLAIALTLVMTTYGLADEPTGEDIYRTTCANCHSLTRGMSTVAPDLHGVIGRKAGSVPAYNYSPALKDAEFVWTREKLIEWIASPHNVVPETEMSFPGLPDAKKRAQVVDFLGQLATR